MSIDRRPGWLVVAAVTLACIVIALAGAGGVALYLLSR
jgi:hypothetical protein